MKPVFLPLLASALTTLAASASHAAECGPFFTCEWISDTATEGEFKITSKRPISGPYNPLSHADFPNSFTGDFWKLTIDLFSETVMPIGGGQVVIKGSFQHTAAADANDAQLGGTHKFDLKINLGNDFVRQPGGDTNWELPPHPAKDKLLDNHLDAYASFLKGTPVAATYKSYVFNVKGVHTTDAFYNETFPVPEPGTWALAACGLGVVLGRRFWPGMSGRRALAPRAA